MTDVNGYDPASKTYRVSFDGAESAPPSVALVDAMAAVTDTDPTALDPLYESVDPDALDDLFGRAGTDAFDGRVTFTYCDREVTIDGSGEIVIDLSED